MWNNNNSNAGIAAEGGIGGGGFVVGGIAQQRPLTPMEARHQMQQAFLSRLLLVVGTLVILSLLTF